MMALWTSRTDRERGLVALAVCVLVVAILQFGVLRPLLSAKANARMTLEAASRQLDVVSAEAIAGAAQASAARPAPVPAEALRSSLLQLATARGVSVSRLQTAEDGRLILQFERAAPGLVYAWLADVDQAHGLAPQRASLFAEGDGLVRASFEFAGGVS